MQRARVQRSPANPNRSIDRFQQHPPPIAPEHRLHPLSSDERHHAVVCNPIQPHPKRLRRPQLPELSKHIQPHLLQKISRLVPVSHHPLDVIRHSLLIHLNQFMKRRPIAQLRTQYQHTLVQLFGIVRQIAHACAALGCRKLIRSIREKGRSNGDWVQRSQKRFSRILAGCFARINRL